MSCQSIVSQRPWRSTNEPELGLAQRRARRRTRRNCRPSRRRCRRRSRPARVRSTIGGAHSRDRHDHLGRDRREHRLQQHQQEDAHIARPVDEADDPIGPSALSAPWLRSRPRSAPAVSVPLNVSIATMPVGEVTLISVSHLPPITSMPTNSSPRALQLRAERGADLLLARGQLGLRPPCRRPRGWSGSRPRRGCG